MRAENQVKIALTLVIFLINPVLAQHSLSEYQVEKIADGFQFLEGPVWKNSGLLFSDIPANTIYRWHPDSGVSVFLSPSGNSNGLALDLSGQLLLAQHGKRRLAVLDNDGMEKPLATHYNGKSLNSPNDIAVKSDGSVFFTDPPYGISPEEEELGFYGIYRLNSEGDLQLLDASLNRPNGIAFSPDEKILYVSDSEARIIYIWDILDDSLIANKRKFAFMNAAGYADGLKIDRNGILFATGPFGVWVYDPNGSILDTILVPGQTTNCNWGDEDGNTLYVTSSTALYRIRELSTDINRNSHGMNQNRSFRLHQNYPNPFNGTTCIPFDLFQPAKVSISVFSCSGEKLCTLVDQFFSAGSYRVPWEPIDLSSGIYFTHMVTDDGSADTKCYLIR